jgi:peroxiredoxin
MRYLCTMQKNVLILFFLFSFMKMKAASDSLTVYVFLSEGCPICQNQTFSLRELYTQFGNQKVGFVGIFPNLEFSTNETMEKFKKKYRLSFPLQRDENQVLTDSLGATITPQVIVIQQNTHSIVYKGKIDNSYERIGKRRPVITEFYLRNALTELLAGKAVTLSETAPVGCFIIK